MSLMNSVTNCAESELDNTESEPSIGHESNRVDNVQISACVESILSNITESEQFITHETNKTDNVTICAESVSGTITESEPLIIHEFHTVQSAMTSASLESVSANVPESQMTNRPESKPFIADECHRVSNIMFCTESILNNYTESEPAHQSHNVNKVTICAELEFVHNTESESVDQSSHEVPNVISPESVLGDTTASEPPIGYESHTVHNVVSTESGSDGITESESSIFDKFHRAHEAVISALAESIPSDIAETEPFIVCDSDRVNGDAKTEKTTRKKISRVGVKSPFYRNQHLHKSIQNPDKGTDRGEITKKQHLLRGKSRKNINRAVLRLEASFTKSCCGKFYKSAKKANVPSVDEKHSFSNVSSTVESVSSIITEWETSADSNFPKVNNTISARESSATPRRSTRNRIKPLDFWRNERRLYKLVKTSDKQDSQIECVGKDDGTPNRTVLNSSTSDTDSSFCVERFKRKTSVIRKTAVRVGVKPHKLDLHTPYNSLKWSNQKTDRTAVTIDSNDITFGFLEVFPSCIKKMPGCSDRNAYFVLLQGSAEITINETVHLLKKADSFMVPYATPYVIRCIGSYTAILSISTFLSPIFRYQF